MTHKEIGLMLDNIEGCSKDTRLSYDDRQTQLLSMANQTLVLILSFFEKIDDKLDKINNPKFDA